MYMDDIKLFTRNEKRTRDLDTNNKNSQNIGIEYGIKKCAMLIMKSGKTETEEGIELPNQERIRTLGE